MLYGCILVPSQILEFSENILVLLNFRNYKMTMKTMVQSIQIINSFLSVLYVALKCENVVAYKSAYNLKIICETHARLISLFREFSCAFYLTHGEMGNFFVWFVNFPVYVFCDRQENCAFPCVFGHFLLRYFRTSRDILISL